MILHHDSVYAALCSLSNSKAAHNLLNIRERLRLLGGRLMIESAPGEGTRVEMHAPSHPERHF
jgi:signal transduction histidine kinase